MYVKKEKKKMKKKPSVLIKILNNNFKSYVFISFFLSGFAIIYNCICHKRKKGKKRRILWQPHVHWEVKEEAEDRTN